MPRHGYIRRIAADMLREDIQSDGVPAGELTSIFEREPAPLKEFVESGSYLGNPPLGVIQYDFVRHLEQIYRPDLYPAMVEEFGEEWMPVRFVNFLVAQWGKGAGKDHCCRIGVTRAADLLSCLRSPQEYFNKPPQDEIHIINVAASADQARRAFFSPMKKLFVSNEYLAQYFRHDYRPGEMATSIRLKKGIELVSGHSMAETQEGLNIIVAIADEISAFKTQQELERSGRVLEGRSASNSAEGIVKVLHTSARTRFPESFKLAQISYPRFRGDAIQQATMTGRENIRRHGEESQYYVSGPFPTWEVNPGVASKDYFQSDYEEDSETAKAMYECDPPAAVNRFMRNDIAIYAAFYEERPDPIEVEYFWGLPEHPVESSLAPPEKPSWQVRFHFNPGFYAMDGALYALHGDLAISGDRAGVAMSHVRSQVERLPNRSYDDDLLEPRPIIRNDFVFGFEANLNAVHPDSGDPAPREIQIRWYRQLVWELMARGFYVASATFDNFQSEDMVQILESRGVVSGKLSLDRNDKVYQTFKDVVYDNRLESYNRPLVVDEVRRLRKLPNGKIDHPDGGSKDESDALAGSVWGAIEVGGDEGDEPTPVEAGRSFGFVENTIHPDSSKIGFGGDLALGINPGELAGLSFGSDTDLAFG